MKFAWLFLCLGVVVGAGVLSRAEGSGTARSHRQTAGVAINEILADPPDAEEGDANHDGVRHTYDDEFVEIFNAGADTVNLSGWWIADASEVRHLFPDSVRVLLAPGDFVTVFGGGEPSGFGTGAWVASTGKLGLNNSEDLVVLVSATGDTVDAHAYGSEGGRNESLIRVPDGTGEWTTPSAQEWEWRFSPQEPNSGEAHADATSWGRLKLRHRGEG
jgi:hypothetical protein